MPDLDAHTCTGRSYSPRVFAGSLADLETGALMAAAALFGADAVLFLHPGYEVHDNDPVLSEHEGRYSAFMTVCEVT